MIRCSIFPGRYIQGEDSFKVVGDELKRLGDNALFVLTHYVYENYLNTLEKSVKGKIKSKFDLFNGECSDEEIDRITGIARSRKVNIIIGVGGGKTIDTAKITAFNIKSPVVIIPTIASTDAPCSANSVIYTKDGEFKRYFMLPKNPDVVLIDTKIIANAPTRFLVSGMGDALSTKFEAQSCREKYANNLTGYKGTYTAYKLADLCYDILINYGLLAKQACEKCAVTQAFEHIVEANTLLSGLGFESGGLAAAHAIHNGLTVLSQTHRYYHGEKVAVGTLASLFLTDKDRCTIDNVFRFCISVGLPVTLEDIGLTDIKDEDLLKVSEASCKEGETIYNEPIPVIPQDVFNALKTADEYGHYLKDKV